MKEIEVDIKEDKRIDKFIAEKLADKSRSKIKKSIKNGLVTVNGKKVTKASKSVKFGQTIVIKFKKKKKINYKPQNINLDIVYEDSHIIIINKPKNMIVHPNKHTKKNTLVNALLYHFQKLSNIDNNRPGIVHRLDKDTTGLIIVAKTDKAHKKLSKMIEERNITKKYWALCKGRIKTETGEIVAPIGRNKKNRTKMDVVLKGRYAETHYKVIKYYNKYSLLEYKLETGRTHQIRVHSLFIGHPIVGDEKYQGKIDNKDLKFINRPLLHSKILKFNHPITNKKISLDIELPEDFKKALKVLKI